MKDKRTRKIILLIAALIFVIAPLLIAGFFPDRGAATIYT